MKKSHLMTRVFCLLLFLYCQVGVADTGFTIRNIRVTGLQRISLGTVLDYLPVSVGDRVGPAKTGNIIRQLYKTGFFENIRLDRRGNSLVIHVEERPTIGELSFRGNKEIAKDKLTKVLEDQGATKGHVYKRSTLSMVKKSLLREYYAHGKYNATVNVNVRRLQRNRVAVDVDINEGETAEIREIAISGNHHFSDRTLKHHMNLRRDGLFSFLRSGTSHYSKPLLEADLEALRTFYMDRGYLKFKITHQQVSITPDKRDVYINIRLHEGEQYRVSDYQIIGMPKDFVAAVNPKITLHPGDVFSRKVITKMNKVIGDYLGNQGYYFANIQADPKVNTKDKTVLVRFIVNPGKRVYVRRINFHGNVQTADAVLRREMRQMEGGVISVKHVKSSERHLRLLEFVKKAEVKPAKVPGTDDQVDLNFKITENPTAQLSLGLGYSDAESFLVNARFQQNNFLGTGKLFGFEVDNSRLHQTYSMDFNNPYYTIDGVSRGFSIYSKRYTPKNLDIARYSTRSYGGSFNFGYPIGDNDRISFSFGYTGMKLSPGARSVEEAEFIRDHGRTFDQIRLIGTWNYNGQDRVMFPTRGLKQVMTGVVNFPANNRSLSYYKINYNGTWYKPLVHDFILSLHGGVGYGHAFGKTDELPFFEHFYAGGASAASGAMVRGYEALTIGPKDSTGRPIGGNFFMAGSLGLVLPNIFESEAVRTILFLDAGSAYNTSRSLALGDLRYSVGITLEWRTPVAPLEFSLSKPINDRPGDKTRTFQFNIATSF